MHAYKVFKRVNNVVKEGTFVNSKVYLRMIMTAVTTDRYLY